MNELLQEVITWFDGPKIVGTVFALVTGGYILFLSIKHHSDFWDGIKGEDNKLNFLEAALTIWLVLYASMVTADFAFGLVASEKVWWSMDSVFLVGVGGRTLSVMNRDNKAKKADNESVS